MPIKHIFQCAHCLTEQTSCHQTVHSLEGDENIIHPSNILLIMKKWRKRNHQLWIMTVCSPSWRSLCYLIFYAILDLHDEMNETKLSPPLQQPSWGITHLHIWHVAIPLTLAETWKWRAGRDPAALRHSAPSRHRPASSPAGQSDETARRKELIQIMQIGLIISTQINQP